ncbi:hypothetical protein Loshitsa2_00028 [Erwinia phage Loshitsa2]|uniref:Uncharacterized protein n=2 Tax=Micantvirus TaxID=3424950 RepID=A0AAE9JVU0_9CAUD|nr:hypothetical protein Micant_00028 [Erwinia phage Micant]UNA01156.1 hypothetical protein Loshitsa2_00028 [Erwinia phage Loshitsa2]
MATIKSLKIKAFEYFYADNFKDLEDVMTTLREKSPAQADKLRDEFSDLIRERVELEEIGDNMAW